MQTLVIRAENANQVEILLRLAKEMNIQVEIAESDSTDKHAILKLAETSFAKDWDSEEDEVWTDFINKREYVSAR